MYKEDVDLLLGRRKCTLLHFKVVGRPGIWQSFGNIARTCLPPHACRFWCNCMGKEAKRNVWKRNIFIACFSSVWLGEPTQSLRVLPICCVS